MLFSIALGDVKCLTEGLNRQRKGTYNIFSSFAIGLYLCHISFNKFVGIIDWISSIDRSYSCTVQHL